MGYSPRVLRAATLAILLASACLPRTALAQPTEGTPAAPPPERAASFPFLARSIEPTTFVRASTALGTYADDPMPGPHGYVLSQLFSFGLAVTDWLVPYVRGGWAFSHDRSDREAAMFANVEAGASAIFRLSPELRAAAHLSLYLPFGSGQGSSTSGLEQRTRQEAQRTRMGVAAPIHLTNDFGIGAYGSFGWVHDGLVAQLELGLEPVFRTAGSGDDAALAVTGAVHFAFFPLPQLSIGVDLSHHQWAAGRPVGGSPDAITAIAAGLRAHFAIDSVVLRPGLAYAHALGGPIEQADYHVLEIDLLVDL
jgi:hypothetical protein